jgi:hypothetical protein
MTEELTPEQAVRRDHAFSEAGTVYAAILADPDRREQLRAARALRDQTDADADVKQA